MAIFATAAGNKSQPLNLDYVDAAVMVNQDCGPNFVNGTVPSASGSSSSSAATRVSHDPMLVGTIMMMLVGAVQVFAWL